MEKAQDTIAQAPEVRDEKVAALKAAVENGTYQIDSLRLANILLALLLTEE
jgi:flagellar biosynthesis anti-sigma factor FlgM